MQRRETTVEHELIFDNYFDINMKFTVSSSALLSLLATTGKVISNKSSLPILEYFLMSSKTDS